MTMRLNDHLGLACTGWTWLLAGAVFIAWLAGLAAAVRRTRGGTAAGMVSPFAFFWVGFAVDFVVRFGLLAYDSVEFGNDTFRLADVPGRVVERAVLLSLGYWLVALAGYLAWPRGERAGAFGRIGSLAGDAYGRGRLLVLVGCTACVVLGLGAVPLPLALVTPISIVGRLWVVPAAFTWADAWRGDASARRLRWIVLAPAVLTFVLSPFREHLVPLALVPLLTLVCVRGTVPRRAMLAAAGGLVLFLALGPLTDTYRNVRWGGYSASQLGVGDPAAGKDFEELPDPAWLVTVRRFHGFDSLLLTVDLVPSVYDFSGSGLLVEAFVRGVVPRALLPGKAKSDRGQEFARSIWSYDSEDPSDAAIAPSMPGDLYRGGGASLVLAGALVWGLLLGALDGWSTALGPRGRAAVLALFATQILPSVERDFGHCVATYLQTLLVCWIVTAVLSRLWAMREAEMVWEPGGEVRA